MTTTHRSRRRSRRATLGGAGLLAVSLLAACTSGSSNDSADTVAATASTAPAAATTAAPTGDTTGDTTGASDAPSTTGTGAADTVDQSLTGPAPGVTDSEIKIGVTYVDTKALKAVGLNYDLGPHAAVYQALADDINAKGGINGRQVKLVLAPIDPTGPAAGRRRLPEADGGRQGLRRHRLLPQRRVDVPARGAQHRRRRRFQSEAPERSRAKAPWAAWLASADQSGAVTQKFADRNLLDGKVAVYAAVADKPDLDKNVMPVLDKLGIKPVAVGIMDAPTTDTAAIQNSVKLNAEKFKAAGADTVLLVGIGAANWPQYMASDTSFRPKLLFTELLAQRAFYTSKDTTDTSILEGSLAGGGYGPDQARFDESTMQDCVAILKAAGVATPAPSQFKADDPSNQPYQAAFQACPDMWLTRALLERAGENLNYGTLEAAIDGLKITIPGDPAERTYGPPPDSDGNPAVYLYSWDQATKNVKLEQG